MAVGVTFSDRLATLQDVIADSVMDAGCDVADVVVTAGRPAAPDNSCTIVYVWGGGVADDNQADPNACQVVSRWTMQYEIWTCYPEGWEDQVSTEDAAAVAECFTSLIEVVWCGLVEAHDDGVFGGCDWTELAPLTVQPRSGGAISALGAVTVPYECIPPVVDTSP